MMSDSFENRPKSPQTMSNRSSQDNACGHMEIVSMMSVTVSKDWIDALKTCGDNVDCKGVLNEIVSQTKQNSHNVVMEGTSRLKGCFCGIKEIRTALQDMITKKQHKEKNIGKLISDEVSTKMENESHLESGNVETEEMRYPKPVAQMDHSSLRKVQEKQNEVDNRSKDQAENNEKSEFLQRNENNTSVLRSGEEDSNSENFNLGEKIQKRQRKLLLKHEEMKTIPNEDKEISRDVLEKEGTSKNTEHSENLKHQAEHRDSTIYPNLHQNPNNNPELDRIYALMLVPSADIDEDIFYYLIRHQNHELSRISKKCNLFEPYKVEQKHKLAVDVKPNYEMKSVLAEFQKLCNQATVHNLRISGGVDFESLKSSVEGMAELKDVELRFISEERVCKIVGSSKDVNRAMGILHDIIGSNTHHRCDASTNRVAQQTVQYATTAKDREPTVQWYPATPAFNAPPTGRSAFNVLNHTHESLLLSALNSLTIEVKREDLTKIRDMDVVVSFINHQLDIDDPVAHQIIQAAGLNVSTELAVHKSRLSFLHTGQMVCTSAGSLKGVKALLHVVRPEVFEFPPTEQRSRDVLRMIFTNFFWYTNYELRLNSICLPPVGLGSYGAEMVANCFLDAVEMFTSTVANPSAASYQHPQHLKYIKLVCNNFHCVGQLMQCVRQSLGSW